MKKENKLNKFLLFLAPLAFYVFFAFYDGVIISVDSGSYIDMYEYREPLYPLLIALFRILFNKTENYLFVLVVFQSILLAYVTFEIANYFYKEFELKDYMPWIIEVILFGVSCLCRFASKKGLMYSNTILTESITYPLFLLFIRYIYDYLIHKDKKSLIISFALVFLLIATRKQMYISFIMLFFAVIITEFCIKNFSKGFLKALLICAVVFASSKAIDYAYIYANYNVVSGHTNDNRFIATMLYYVADDGDSEYIEDDNAKYLFETIYEESKINGYILNSASGNWYEKFTHFNKNYDNIQIDTMMPIMDEYITKNIDVSDKDVDIVLDEINNTIIKSLLIKKLPDIIDVTIGNFFAGLMLTVTANRQILMHYAALVYALYIGLTIYLIKRSGLNKYTIFAILVLISIILNVGIVSLVIFNQTRYTIYNMPLFYIAGLLMLYNLLIDKKKANNYEEDK